MPRYFRNNRYNDYQPSRGRGTSRGRGRGRGWSRGGSRDRSGSTSISRTLTRLGLNQQQIRTVLNMRNDTSHSDDASDVCFRYAKIFNHQQNWLNLPKSLQWSLDRFTNSIHLPATNTYSRDEINQAATEFADRLCEIARFHLSQESDRLVQQLKQLHVDNIRAVQQETARRLKPRFSRSFIDNCWSTLDEHLREITTARNLPEQPMQQRPTSASALPSAPTTAVPSSGSLPTPDRTPTRLRTNSPMDLASSMLPVVSADIHTNTTTPAFVVASTASIDANHPAFVAPPLVSSFDKGTGALAAAAAAAAAAEPPSSVAPLAESTFQLTKRSAPGPPEAPPRNREGKRTLTPDQEQPDSKHGKLQLSGRLHASPISVESTDSDNSEGVLSEDCRDNSSKWSIGTVPAHCHTVIIGDSNLVHWDKKEKIYIKSFRGAHLVDITRILINWDVPSHVSSLVIAVGVNNHVKTNPQNQNEFNELALALNNLSLFKYFLEVHVSSLHTEVAATRLRFINLRASDSFGERFIQLKVPLKYTDSQHYDKETASAISKQVFHFLHY